MHVFWTCFFKVDYCIGFLELVGVGCRILGGESINSVRSNSHGISWCLVSTVGREIVNLRRVILVHFVEREK